MQRILMLFWLSLFHLSLSAQADIREGLALTFNPILNGQNLQLEEEESKKDSAVLKIESLRFYLSDFVLLKSENIIWSESDSYHLLDANDDKSLIINLQHPSSLSFDKIQFQLGIDSMTNVSGAMGGDLDPTKGMYWTWNSGYINFKLEGKSPNCPARKNEFQFHLGGYASPFQTIQSIQLDISNSKEININVDISTFLNQIDLSQQYQIMSPGEDAKKLSVLASTIFYLDEKE